MTATTHRLGGLAAGMAAVQLLPGDISILCEAALITGSLLGCLIPDIDNARSSISHKFRPVSILVSAGQAIARVFATLLPRKQEKYVHQIVGHRGISHSLFMAILSFSSIFLVSAWLGSIEIKMFGVGVAIGIVSHILLDMFANGVPLLAPFTMRRITLAHIKTGGAVEWCLRMTSIALMAGWVYKMAIII